MNNAGIARPQPPEQITEQDWDEVVTITVAAMAEINTPMPWATSRTVPPARPCDVQAMMSTLAACTIVSRRRLIASWAQHPACSSCATVASAAGRTVLGTRTGTERTRGILAGRSGLRTRAAGP